MRDRGTFGGKSRRSLSRRSFVPADRYEKWDLVIRSISAIGILIIGVAGWLLQKQIEESREAAAQADARGKRQCAAMDVVAAVRVHEVREPRRAADAGERHDFFLRVVELFEDAVKSRKDGEVATAGAPRGVIGGQRFLGELGRGSNRGGRG